MSDVHIVCGWCAHCVCPSTTALHGVGTTLQYLLLFQPDLVSRHSSIETLILLHACGLCFVHVSKSFVISSCNWLRKAICQPIYSSSIFLRNTASFIIDVARIFEARCDQTQKLQVPNANIFAIT